ncbi:MAG: hypothetical protein U1E22_05760, partial [Coriobacteriia bacterium]|nr:hypothetical protein [Coriobacteriia bacterium]
MDEGASDGDEHDPSGRRDPDYQAPRDLRERPADASDSYRGDRTRRVDRRSRPMRRAKMKGTRSAMSLYVVMVV